MYLRLLFVGVCLSSASLMEHMQRFRWKMDPVFNWMGHPQPISLRISPGYVFPPDGQSRQSFNQYRRPFCLCRSHKQTGRFFLSLLFLELRMSLCLRMFPDIDLPTSVSVVSLFFRFSFVRRPEYTNWKSSVNRTACVRRYLKSFFNSWCKEKCSELRCCFNEVGRMADYSSWESIF